MTQDGHHTYVGFGFGAIQAGLFLLEAFRSGNFARLVVAEVMPDVVRAIRDAGGFYSVNIAHSDRIEQARVGPVGIYDPAESDDRERLVAAIAEAQEIGTAIPSVALYTTDGPASLHRVLADGLVRKVETDGPLAVIYTAENHNRAAVILREAVLGEVPAEQQDAVRARVRFLNTVIGKMSGVAGSPSPSPCQGEGRGERRLPKSSATSEVLRLDKDFGSSGKLPKSGRRTFLVEAFNRILISRIRFVAQPPPAAEKATGEGACATEPAFRRGIEVFEEKDDLLPFEEAKLYGHNATHALAAYLGQLLGVKRIADLRDAPGMMGFLREAFIEESGAALIAKWAGCDPLFTEVGYAAYVDDLLERMTNPYLMDTVKRVGRDPGRKLGWNDRLIGTMRVALAQGIEPRRYAIGAAAAFAAMDDAFLDNDGPAGTWARPIWRSSETIPPTQTLPREGGGDQTEEATVLGLIADGRRFLRAWRDAGFPNVRDSFAETQS